MDGSGDAKRVVDEEGEHGPAFRDEAVLRRPDDEGRGRGDAAAFTGTFCAPPLPSSDKAGLDRLNDGRSEPTENPWRPPLVPRSRRSTTAQTTASLLTSSNQSDRKSVV